MARICEAAGTGERYTDHLVRVTAVSRLNEAGFLDREICAITGNGSSDGLQSYNMPNREKQKLMATALDGQFPAKRPWEGSATVSEQACESSFDAGAVSFTGARSVFKNVTINVTNARYNPMYERQPYPTKKKFDLSKKARLARRLLSTKVKTSENNSGNADENSLATEAQ